MVRDGLQAHLVNGAGYEAADVLPGAKHFWEGRWQAGRSLDSWEGDLADAVLGRQPKDATHLVHGHRPASAHAV